MAMITTPRNGQTFNKKASLIVSKAGLGNYTRTYAPAHGTTNATSGAITTRYDGRFDSALYYQDSSGTY